MTASTNSTATIKEIYETMEYGPAPESADHAMAWLADHKQKFGHYIDGKWVLPKDGKFMKTVNPATGEKLADVLDGTAKDVDTAVKAARKALPAWQALSPFRRITASRSAKHVILMCRWRRVTSITMPVGRSCWRRSFRAMRRMVLSVRSFRGISRC